MVFSSVQSLSCVRLFATLWTAACQASLSITNSQSLLKLMSIELVMPSNHLILCHPLLLLPYTLVYELAISLLHTTPKLHGSGRSADFGWAHLCVCGQLAGYLGPGRPRMAPLTGMCVYWSRRETGCRVSSPSTRLLRLVHELLGKVPGSLEHKHARTLEKCFGVGTLSLLLLLLHRNQSWAILDLGSGAWRRGAIKPHCRDCGHREECGPSCLCSYCICSFTSL